MTTKQIPAPAVTVETLTKVMRLNEKLRARIVAQAPEEIVATVARIEELGEHARAAKAVANDRAQAPEARREARFAWKFAAFALKAEGLTVTEIARATERSVGQVQDVFKRGEAAYREDYAREPKAPRAKGGKAKAAAEAVIADLVARGVITPEVAEAALAA